MRHCSYPLSIGSSETVRRPILIAPIHQIVRTTLRQCCTLVAITLVSHLISLSLFTPPVTGTDGEFFRTRLHYTQSHTYALYHSSTRTNRSLISNIVKFSFRSSRYTLVQYSLSVQSHINHRNAERWRYFASSVRLNTRIGYFYSPTRNNYANTIAHCIFGFFPHIITPTPEIYDYTPKPTIAFIIQHV